MLNESKYSMVWVRFVFGNVYNLIPLLCCVEAASTSVWFLVGFSVVVVVVTSSWVVMSLLVERVVNMFLALMSLPVCFVTVLGLGHCKASSASTPLET